jgi:putative N6-adenine-specific DNA methylase
LESAYGKVRFTACIKGLYRSLLGLRAADRVLLEAARFSAHDFEGLFNKTHEVAWEKLIPAGTGLKITKVRSNRSRLQAETSIQAIAHKAAAQKLCSHFNLQRLPESGIEAELRVHIEKDIVSLLLDLSGRPLFMRGYRKEGGTAPLRETTAAALLLLSGWKRKYPLYDPFCGSGTILAEALMFAWDMAPGIGRQFALENLAIADAAAEEEARASFLASINFERTIRIAGSDEDGASAALAASNIKRAKALGQSNKLSPDFMPDIRTLPMNEARPPFETSEGDGPRGFIITNPPYGKRLGDPGTSLEIYKGMPSLAKNFPGWKLGVITDFEGFESAFGRQADSCREISGGATPAFFFQYERL